MVLEGPAGDSSGQAELVLGSVVGCHCLCFDIKWGWGLDLLSGKTTDQGAVMWSCWQGTTMASGHRTALSEQFYFCNWADLWSSL